MYRTFWQYIPPCENITKKLPFGKKCGGSYKLMFVVFVMILAYNVFMAMYWPNTARVDVDIFNRKVLDFDYFLGNCCSMWPISHFIFFFVLGILFPQCAVPVIAGGILWEMFEEGIAIIPQKTRHVTTTNGKIQYRDSWWAGSMQDILFNILGFYFGKYTLAACLRCKQLLGNPTSAFPESGFAKVPKPASGRKY